MAKDCKKIKYTYQNDNFNKEHFFFCWTLVLVCSSLFMKLGFYKPTIHKHLYHITLERQV